MDNELILSLYDDGAQIMRTHHNEFPEDRDERYCFETEYPNRRLAVKAHRNAYTDIDRVAGWAKLIAHYNSLGIYCPSIVPDKNGSITSSNGAFTVWAEEYFEGRVLRDKDDNAAQLPPEHILRGMYETIGILAANPAPRLSFSGVYCMYEKFSPADLSDECSEYADALVPLYEEHAPQLAARAGELVARWRRLREDFEPTYRALPEATFQSDLSFSNVIITESGDFDGIVDFNLSGNDKILNYALCECYVPAFLTATDEVAQSFERVLRLDRAEINRIDEQTVRRLGYVARHYRFTDAEKRAFGAFYNVAMPFRATNWSYYMDKFFENAAEYAEPVLNLIEYYLTRNDADIILP